MKLYCFQTSIVHETTTIALVYYNSTLTVLTLEKINPSSLQYGIEINSFQQGVTVTGKQKLQNKVEITWLHRWHILSNPYKTHIWSFF